MTKLEKPLQRALLVGGNPYTPTVDPEELERVEKERRKGTPRAWTESGKGDAGSPATVQASATEPPR
jgi:hypothetical protein